MGIIGITFNTISARVNDDRPENVNINVNSSPRLIDMKEKNLDVSGIGKVLEIKFSFSTDYDPDIGSIKFNGSVLYNSEDNAKMLKKWDKDKTLDDDKAIEVLNSIFRRCLAKALDISQELRLPPPMQFPKVTIKPSGEE